jgi:hypothetical protein
VSLESLQRRGGVSAAATGGMAVWSLRAGSEGGAVDDAGSGREGQRRSRRGSATAAGMAGGSLRTGSGRGQPRRRRCKERSRRACELEGAGRDGQHEVDS